MGLFSSKNPKLAVMFDVGSASVGVAVALLSPGSKPKVIFTAREHMVFQENLKFDRFVSSMLDALLGAGGALLHFSLPPNSGQMFSVFFASPWYASQTRISRRNFPEPTVITDEVLRDIQKKEVQDFQEFEMQKLGKDAIVLETETIQVKLNGYETAVPKGKTASAIQTSTYVSIAPQNIATAVSKKISGLFHNRNISAHSFSFVSFAVIRDIFAQQKSFFFVDISGEVTDVSLIRDNVLQETRTFPLGKNALLRKIASGLGASYAEALSFFAMSKESALHPEQQQKVKKVLDEAREEWLSAFQGSLEEVAKIDSFLPHDLFFTADADVSQWFMENIQDHESHKLILADKSFVVRPLDAAFLSSFCETASGVDRDPFLMTEAIFLSKLTE
ncbi:MAG: cell division FtsA domain-containing protein [Parcubacteria group bacterium]|nr:cell division FtsA domain-containing protein [Parcubacteria group bacterium]